MKKILTGGFLGLFGIIGILVVGIYSYQDMLTEYYGNRLLYTMTNGDFSIIFFGSLILLIGGIALMLVGCFKKDK